MSRARRKNDPRYKHLVARDNPAVPCPSCGVRVAQSRLGEHFREPACLVDETRAWFEGLGWEPLVSGSGGRAEVTLRDVCAALDIPHDATPAEASAWLRWAPVRVGVDHEREARPEVTGGGRFWPEVVVEGWYCPAEVLVAVRLLEGLGLPPGLRSWAARAVWRDPTFADALRSALALSGRTAARLLIAAVFEATGG